MNYDERYAAYPSRIEGILLEGFGAMADAPEVTGGSISGGKVIGTEDGKTVISAELRVDDAADLPAADDIEGYILRDSLALVVHTGDIYAQDSEGEWYNQTTPATAGTLSAAGTTAIDKGALLSRTDTADILSYPADEDEPDITADTEEVTDDETDDTVGRTDSE